MFQYRFFTYFAFAALLCGAYSPFAYAQDAMEEATQEPTSTGNGQFIDILPAASAEQYSYNEGDHTHPVVKLTPDKSELVRLDQPAGSIIVGNPNHLSILADSSDTIVLVPRQPGATHFTVLNKQGEIIMQRHVIVASPKEKYIRVRRSCATGGDENCQATSVFYCPDMCHEILLGGNEDAATNQAATPPTGGTGSTETAPVVDELTGTEAN